MVIYITKKTLPPGKKWRLVFDFCAYKRKKVKSIWQALRGKLELYVFISTDNVYAVCDPAVRGEEIVEEDSVRPYEEDEIKRLAKKYKYAHKKLQCEEYLHNHAKDDSQEDTAFRYFILRLGEVIGPFDGTLRLFVYLEWMFQSHIKPLILPSSLSTQPISFTYSEDLSCFLSEHLLTRAPSSLHTSCLNFSSFTVALPSLLSMLKGVESLGPQSAEVLFSAGMSGLPLPRVPMGTVSNSRFVKKFDFLPTQAPFAALQILSFWERARHTNATEIFRVRALLADLWNYENNGNNENTLLE